MSRLRALLPWVAAWLGGIGLAQGQQPPAADADFTQLEELPIVLTPSRLPQPQREAPAAMTVLDRELIDAAGYRDITRLLRLVPGMQVGQERAGHHWVTYHGLGSDEPSDMQVLVDGRAMVSPGSFAGLDWAALPVTAGEIDRIEVVRGTDAVAYGSNAFLGVINIITKDAGTTRGWQASASAGSANAGDLRLSWSGGADGHALRVAAASRRDDGFAGLHDSNRMNTVSLRSDSRLGNRDELTLRLAASEGMRQLGYPDSAFGNNGEREWHSRNSAFQAQWRHAAAPGEELLVNFFRSEDWARDEWLAAGPRIDLLPAIQTAFSNLNRNRQAVRHSLEAQHRLQPFADTQLVWGAEARQESIRAPFLFYGRDELGSRLLRLFGNLEWRPARGWTANLGAMAEKYSDDRARLSPRAFANWQASPAETLRAGWSRAWRDRNLFERYGDVRAFDRADGTVLVRPYLPNPDLRPSRIDSVELGYLARFRPGNTTLDVRLFNERIAGFIVRRQQPVTPDNPVLAVFMPPTRYENLDSAVTLRGLEYQLRTRPAADTQILWSHAMIARRTADPAVAHRAAPYTASLSWLQDWGGGWSSMASLLRMGPLAGGDGYVPRFDYVAQPYTTLDARVARRLKMGGQDAEVALSAINLGPRHQEIADRSEQFLHPEGPVNRTSRAIYLTISVGAK